MHKMFHVPRSKTAFTHTASVKAVLFDLGAQIAIIPGVKVYFKA